MTRPHPWLVGILVISMAPALISMAQPAAAQLGHLSSRTCPHHVANQIYAGQAAVIDNGRCVANNQASQAGDQQPRAEYRTVACLSDGSVELAGQRAPGSCGGAPVCKRVAGGTDTGPAFIEALAAQTRPPGANDWITLSYWCPQHQDPVTAPTATDVRDRVIRLLPKVAAKTTAPNTLVNIQTLLWAATAAHRDLGRVNVLAQPVWIQLDFDHADWNFGDGHTDVTSTPGKVYDPVHDRCTTVDCPDYYGHTYRTTGDMTITVTISWQATYSLDGTHYAPVGATPITGPPATVHIRARQARAQLVDTG